MQVQNVTNLNELLFPVSSLSTGFFGALCPRKYHALCCLFLPAIVIIDQLVFAVATFVVWHSRRKLFAFQLHEQD